MKENGIIDINGFFFIGGVKDTKNYCQDWLYQRKST